MDLLAIDLDFEVSESKLERNKRLKQKVSIETDGWTPRVQCFGHLSKNGVVLGEEAYILEQSKFAAEEQYYLGNYSLAKKFAFQALDVPTDSSSIEYHRLSSGEINEIEDIIRRCEMKLENKQSN
ncbi:hypothetical protein POMI540_3104 [Schizosaccharomyces pombe]